jgi:F-type H+-transporting ATPase subunit a
VDRFPSHIVADLIATNNAGPVRQFVCLCRSVDIGEQFVTSALHGAQAEIHAAVTKFGLKSLGCERSLTTRRTEILAKRRIKLILFFLAVFLILGTHLTLAMDTTFAAASLTPSPATQQGGIAETNPEKQEHGLPQSAVKIEHWGGFITNSMVVSWVVAIALIIFARLATRDMKGVPGGAQNFLEWLVEGLYGFLESIVGPHLVKRTFWFLATIFIFILSANWVGLIPGVGTIGWGRQTPNGFEVEQPLFRGANADLNLTFAMAIIFFACWIFWALQEVGPIGFLKELFAPKGETTGFLKVLMIVVFFASGCLEIVSILFRPISLGFRLYGNVFAGETMLETMARLKPGFGWLLPIPFYFMELLVGLVQALVFMLLCAVFTLLICQHEEATPAAEPNTQ